MKYKLYLVVLFFLALHVNVSAQADLDVQIKEKETEYFTLKKNEASLVSAIEDLKLKRVRRDIQKFGLPKADENLMLTSHSAMVIGFDGDLNIAKWVAHIITPDILTGTMSRTNDFRKDSLLRKATADKEDYWNSGFDRGHLAPSADFRWSRKALSESYFYTNMAPQRPELNREKWAEMEDKLRLYVSEYKEQIYVVTGGVLKKNLPTIGEHKIPVPELFYKVAIDIEGDEKKGIAFIMPNAKCELPVMSYAVSIDSVELLTGIDFFASLPDNEEASLESSFDYKKWLVEKFKEETLPLDPKTLPKKSFNTIQAKVLIGEKACVCGTVVSTKFHEKSGGTFINLDQKFPNQIFSITIWKSDLVNFSYTPHKELMGRKICVTGIVDTNKGVPSMNIHREKDVNFLDDDDFDSR